MLAPIFVLVGMQAGVHKAVLVHVHIGAVFAPLEAGAILGMAHLVATLADHLSGAGVVGLLVGPVDRPDAKVPVDHHKGLLMAVNQRLQVKGWLHE